MAGKAIEAWLEPLKSRGSHPPFWGCRAVLFTSKVQPHIDVGSHQHPLCEVL
ncbi:uncharacterized protein TrAtP1_000822 [Trichoderma atroviride]|uniref:uncharacterized protein n=1 Tax=Hypocrea atroviridis TaxID=63577 RepID=UPI003325E8ED|nr:hypothetical protein TrAtP1_000822 [Trichoderma atroviride]